MDAFALLLIAAALWAQLLWNVHQDTQASDARTRWIAAVGKRAKAFTTIRWKGEE